MKKFIIDNGHIYFATCKKVGQKYEISNKNTVVDATQDILFTVKSYLEIMSQMQNLGDKDPAVVFDDGSILSLKKLNKNA